MVLHWMGRCLGHLWGCELIAGGDIERLLARSMSLQARVSACTCCMGRWKSTRDPLVAPYQGGVGAQGLPTRTQLGEQWADVAAQTARLSKLPDGHGGLLSLAAAGLAARLKVHAHPSHTRCVPCDAQLEKILLAGGAVAHTSAACARETWEVRGAGYAGKLLKCLHLQNASD